MRSQLTWVVKNFDCNRQAIVDYNALASLEKQIKKFKKECSSRDEFAERLDRELMYRYWSRAEYELIVETPTDGRVTLIPWVGCREPDKVRIDVTVDSDFDWSAFARTQVNLQRFGDRAKIDIYDQLKFRWNELVDYCWYTRLKYERDHEKFHK